jgi:hypothetical protein
MIISGLGRTEYHFIWRLDLAAFETLAAAGVAVAEQQNLTGVMAGWRGMLQLPSGSSDEEIAREIAGLLTTRKLLTRRGTFDLVWRHPWAGSRDRTLALQFLKKFRGDSGTIQRFRSLLSQKHQSASLYRLSDDEVFAGIAALMGAGELVVGFRSHQFSSFTSHDDGSKTSPGGQDYAPPPRAAPPPVEQEAPTFANHNTVAQVATLKTAAKKGSPLVEECAAG